MDPRNDVCARNNLAYAMAEKGRKEVEPRQEGILPLSSTCQSSSRESKATTVVGPLWVFNVERPDGRYAFGQIFSAVATPFTKHVSDFCEPELLRAVWMG
eukprot:4520734-Amphidinium_carterae.1